MLPLEGGLDRQVIHLTLAQHDSPAAPDSAWGHLTYLVPQLTDRSYDRPKPPV